jgi:hypothetical protein
MTRRRRIVTAAIAGTVIGFGALGAAASAAADPVPPLVPGEPAPPGQPVIEPAPSGQPVGGDVVAAAPPVGPPMVPEISNPKYGSGQSDGPLGFLRDAWHQAKDPYNFAETPEGQMPGGAPPPPGAGPAPQLPPGFKSLNAPGSEAPPSAPQGAPGTAGGGPPLPEGYYPISGPPPPGYFDGPPPPNAPPGMAPIPDGPPPTP